MSLLLGPPAVEAHAAAPGGVSRVASAIPATSDSFTFESDATITSGDTCGQNACWIGGAYTFSFETTLCHYTSIDVPPSGGCAGSASGMFTSTVCQTGAMTGSATLGATTGPEAAEGFTTVDFNITFVGGVGVLSGTAIEGDGGTGPVDGAAVFRTPPESPQRGAPGDGPCMPTFSMLTSLAIGG